MKGIICCWSAASLQGMSGSYSWNWSFYADISTPIRATNATIFPFPDEHVETTAVGKLVVTTPYQTIIDLIRWDCEMEFVFQAMTWWERKHGSLFLLWEGLSKRGLTKKYEEEYAPFRSDWVDVY